jgi:hypothetical protein
VLVAREGGGGACSPQEHKEIPPHSCLQQEKGGGARGGGWGVLSWWWSSGIVCRHCLSLSSAVVVVVCCCHCHLLLSLSSAVGVVVCCCRCRAPLSFCHPHPHCTPFPPHEQLLVAAVGGAVLVVVLRCHRCWRLACVVIVVGIIPPRLSPLAPLPVVVPPAIHPTSSCSWGWGVGCVVSGLSPVPSPLLSTLRAEARNGGCRRCHLVVIVVLAPKKPNKNIS